MAVREYGLRIMNIMIMIYESRRVGAQVLPADLRNAPDAERVDAERAAVARGVPLFVQVEDDRQQAAVAVRVVDVPHVARPVARVARHHRLHTVRT